MTAPPAWPAFIFNAVLFFAGAGAVFFRAPRDNDDLARMALVLTAGVAVTFIYARRRIRIPLGILLPASGLACAMLLSSFHTFYAPESLKEFLKIGVYLMLFIALAGTGASRSGIPFRSGRITIAATLALIGGIVGYLHSREFLLYSTPQIVASVASSFLFCGAAIIVLSASSVRQAVIRGLILQAFIASLVGIFQFYGFDPLRPWDARQPYDIYIHSGNTDFLRILAGVLHGSMKMAEKGMVLVVPRVLGIYGNPDFYAPFLLHFIPLAVATWALNPRKRTQGIVLSALLLIALMMSNVRGAFVGLIIVSPFFGSLLGYVSGPTDQDVTRKKLLGVGAQALLGAVAYAFTGMFLLRASTSVMLATALIFFAYLEGAVFFHLARRPSQRLLSLLGLGMAVIFLYIVLFFAIRQLSGARFASIEERLVKYVLAGEMWKRSPIAGLGLNTYKTYHPVIQQEVRLRHGWSFEELGSSGTQENRAHNDLAQLLCETGVIGTGMFLWLMASLVFGTLALLKRWKDFEPEKRADICGLIGGTLVILAYMIPNFPFHIVSSAGTFWIIAGLLASYLSETIGDETPAPPPRVSRLLIAAGALTVLVTASFSWRLFTGTIEYKRGDDLARHAKPARPMEAMEHYEKSIALDPSNAQYHYDYGAMCFNVTVKDPKGHPEFAALARRLLLAAKTKGFMSEDLAYGLGHLAEQEGKMSEALHWYSTSTGLKERQPHARQGQVRILSSDLAEADLARERGQFKKARALYAAAFERDRDNWLAALYLGSLSIAPFGETEEGLEELKEATRLAPNEPSVWLGMGKGYAAAGKFNDARRALRMGLVLDPGNRELNGAIRHLTAIEKGPAAPAPGAAVKRTNP